MVTEGKIKTLFSDREQTEAIFPRTATKAIFDEEGTGLEAILSTTVHAKEEYENESETILNNADTLGGQPSEYYATTVDIENITEQIENINFPVKSINGKTGTVVLNAKELGAATESFVKAEIANAKLDSGSGGTVDLSGYATKDDLLALVDPEELAAAIADIDYPVDSVNGKTGAVTLSATDVGALPITGGTLTGQVRVEGNGKLTGIGTGTDDTWLYNSKSNKFLQLKDDGTLSYSNNAIYHTGNKPTPADIGAAASSHNHAASNITSGTLSSDRLPTVPLTKGGLGGTDRLSSAKNLTNEAVSSPGYVVSLTGSWKNFGYTTLQQLRNAAGLGNTTGALPVANGGTGMTTASTASASSSYHTAYFAKFGNLVVCTLVPKANKNSVIYEQTLTIPSGYRPKAAGVFTVYSNTSVTAGGTATSAQVAIHTDGKLNVLSAYGFTVDESSRTFCWVSA